MYTYRFEEYVLRMLIGSNEEEVAGRLGISAETVALIVENQAVARGRDTTAAEQCLGKLTPEQRAAVETHRVGWLVVSVPCPEAATAAAS